MGVGWPLHVGFGLFARLGQAGYTPGLPLTVEQVVHTVFVHVVRYAYVAECGQRRSESVEVVPQRPDNYPVVMG